jgi:hypothetical protein
MPRFRKMYGSVLNIKTHPHSPQKYHDLFIDVFKRGGSVRIFGDNWGAIGNIWALDSTRPLEGLYGVIYRFTRIDNTKPWYDEKKRVEVEAGEEGEFVPDLGNMQPNSKRSVFIFYPEKHRLVFEANNFSPNSARKLFAGLFSPDEIVDEYGDVDVVVESSSESIKRILRIPTMTKLSIDFTLPNPDEIGEAIRERLQERMRSENCKRLIEIKRASKEDGLSPDEETVELMNLAKSNGWVDAEGYDENDKKMEESTYDHPLKDSVAYLSETTSGREAIQMLSAKLLNQVFRM